jgi:hypothetical protein
LKRFAEDLILQIQKQKHQNSALNVGFSAAHLKATISDRSTKAARLKKEVYNAKQKLEKTVQYRTGSRNSKTDAPFQNSPKAHIFVFLTSDFFLDSYLSDQVNTSSKCTSLYLYL